LFHDFKYEDDEWGSAARYAHMSYKRTKEEPRMVRQNEICVSEHQLFTAGLFGCSAVAFTDGKKNFLAHVDGQTRSADIVRAISNNFNVPELVQDWKFTIIMWRNASMANTEPTRIIEDALRTLGLSFKLIDMSRMDEIGPMTEVGVDITGTFCEQPSIQLPIQSPMKAPEIPSSRGLLPEVPLVIGSRINPDLSELCHLFARHLGLPESELPPDPRRDVEAIAEWNAWLQKYFLRPAGKDHQDIATVPRHPLHDQMFPIFERLGLVRAVYPTEQTFDVVAIFGGTPVDTRERMYHLIQLLRSGVIRANEIIYINGRRPLHELELASHGLDTPNVDTPSQPNWIPPRAIPAFQHEMAALIWDQLVDVRTEFYGKFKILTIDPPFGKIRATTEDTIAALLAQHPGMRSCLFISNAPYRPYQHETVRNVFDQLQVEGVRFETSSNQLTRPLTTAPFLDTLARRAFTIDAIEQRHSLKEGMKYN